MIAETVSKTKLSKRPLSTGENETRTSDLEEAETSDVVIIPTGANAQADIGDGDSAAEEATCECIASPRRGPCYSG